MSPRNSVVETARTRARILDGSVAAASVDGLEGLTIAGLAKELGMSGPGVLGHFGTKEALQIATLERGVEVFTKIVIEPAERAAPGLARLRVFCEEWITYMQTAFPGGCLFTAAAMEFDGRRGPVRDNVAGMMSELRKYLTRNLHIAIDAGELSGSPDPGQLAFELMGIYTSLNMSIQLFEDPDAADRTRIAVDRLLATT
jgi:AcrR family transcriptional regulator